jgi:diguanylate cyclase (GGDEF)-like protein
MSRSELAMNRVRRTADDVMVAGSLALLAWPWLFADVVRDGAAGGNVVAVGIPVATVLCATVTVVILTQHRPALRYLPVPAAFVSVALQHVRHDGLTPQLVWLLIGLSSTTVLRQFLGARTTEELLRDLTRQRAQLAEQAHHDLLTGVGNRPLFLQRAGEALADAEDTATAVIVFGLDGFKHVNDTWGNAIGDELLRTAAERLQANIRSHDTVARLGGDEFVVLLPRLVDDRTADTVAGRVLYDLAQPLVVGDTVLTMPASAGIGLVRGVGNDVDSVLGEAVLALQQAKADGKGVARRFDRGLFAAAEQRRRDEKELRAALAEEQFEVHYQPIVDLDGERTVGVEALVRWNHPTRGLLAPVAFLDLAETLGMLPLLGGWVLSQACRQAAEWQRRWPDLEVNVNLSASQLSNPHLVQEVRQVLQTTGLSPELLVLELTESVALTDLAESGRILRDLKTLGIRLALDDFGTGFSSLTHLGALPVDVMKIDRSFVQAMAESSGATVAEAVLQIARTFGLAPVAEGVEDAAQASRLRDLHCAQAQGFHFARPMPAAELTARLSRRCDEADLLA